MEDGGPCRVRHFSVGKAGDYRGLRGTTGPQSFYSLADCEGRRGQRSLAVGRGATFEKDRTGPPNAVPRRPAPGRTDCPVANTENKLDGMIQGDGLRSTYSVALARIKAHKRSKSRLGMEALMWLSHPERSLETDELCYALKIVFPTAQDGYR